jgi:membrane protease YdiL (CAAX protease family)
MVMIDEELSTEVEPKPFRFTILHAVGLMVLFVSLQLWVSFLLSHSGVPEWKDSNTWLHISIANGISGFLTIAAGAVLAGFSWESIWRSMEIKVHAIIPAILCAAGLAILSSELSNLLQSIRPISEDYTKLYDSLMNQNLFGLLFAVAVIAPVTEELIFRGMIQDGLLLSYRSQTAILTSGILFGLVHGLPWLILNAFLLGLFFSWLRLKTGSLGAGILAHAIYNAIPFVLTKGFKLEIPGLTTLEPTAVTFQPLWLDLLGFGLLTAGVLGIVVFFKTAETEKVVQSAENVV